MSSLFYYLALVESNCSNFLVNIKKKLGLMGG